MRMTALIALTVLFAGVSAAEEAAEVDLNKIERRIAKEPAYSAKEPRYALAVFGREGKTRVWLVLDKSKAELTAPDILYADLNANGDLTEAGERFTTKVQQDNPRAIVNFDLPEFVDPATGERHGEFKVRVSRDRGYDMVSLRWRGKHKLGGGYPVDPDGGYMSFASTVKAAPILWFNGDGPFRFQRWLNDPFRIGGSDQLRLFLGNPGLGASTFCGFQEHVLPESEGVQATLLYHDRSGAEKQTTFELKERC